jgi:Flp pilus assembly protein TadB
MVAHAGEGPILLAKKLGGLLLIIVGCLLTAVGVNAASTGLTVVGALLVIAGLVLLVLKILRRNEGRPG